MVAAGYQYYSEPLVPPSGYYLMVVYMLQGCIRYSVIIIIGSSGIPIYVKGAHVTVNGPLFVLIKAL